MLTPEINGWPEGKHNWRELTREERDHICELNPPNVDFIHYASMHFDWSWIGCGFGQISVDLNLADKKIEIMNECMSRNSIRTFLHIFADYIADRAILVDNPEDIPPIDFSTELNRIQQDVENKKRIREEKRFARAQKKNMDVL